ncbi:hypothetical protein N2152v2_004491 [Parachlorella kessleri]
MFKLRGTPAEVQQAEDVDQQVPQAAAIPARGVNRMQAGMRRRRAGGRAVREAASSEDEEDEPRGEGRAGQQAAGEDDVAAAAEALVSKRSAYEAKRAAKDAERQAQEDAQEAEIRRAAEERAKREEEEAAKWMHLFTVEAAGREALSREQEEALETRFVQHIKARKTVALDELAAEFGMKTQEAIQRLQTLEEQGRLTGVMDDRGKYIYISREEMAAVAEFIRSRGRIAIAELAQRSNAFIDLSARELEQAEVAALELPEALAAA